MASAPTTTRPRVLRALARGPVAFTLALILVAGLTALELTRSRRPTTARGGAEALRRGAPETAAFPLLGGPAPSPGMAFATDPGAVSPSLPILLWGVERASGGLRLTPWTLVSHRGWIAGTARTIPAGAGTAPAAVGVGTWGAHGHVALLARPRSGGIDVTVRDLDAGGRLVASGTAPGVGPAPAAGRDLRFARFLGGVPDLVVVDRDRDPGSMLVRVFSGASGFRQLVALTRVPYGGFPAVAWSLAVGSVNTTEPDLLLATRSQATRTGRAEIHVLTATSGYRTWGEQRALPLPSSDTATGQIAIGHINAVPFLYVITPGSRTVRLVAL